MKGTVHRTGGGVYEVLLDDGRRVEASLRGRLKLERRTGDRVVVGDRVEVREDEAGAWTVEAVEPRRTEITRRGVRGRTPKVVAANVDRLVVVVAALRPKPRPERIDRLLVIAESHDVRAALVVNKLDLPGADEVAAELAELYRSVGYPVLATSAAAGMGMDELSELLCSGTSVLVGPSGVGKSSLLNVLEPELELRTGELSRKVGRGRHTTVSARLIPLGCGGFVVDTPGFSDVGVWGVNPDELDRCFPEFESFLEGCRFRRCTHRHEPGCAVLEAVEEGRIARSRWESYDSLTEEAEESGRGG